MPRRLSWRLACLALPLFAAAQGVAVAAPAAASSAETAKPAAMAAIDGFRDAHFGMTEPELRRAIHEDFPKGAVAVAINPVEKTTILSLTAGNLLPDTGPARISYILGYRSKRLIQVNILWASNGTSAASDDEVVASANALRDYFSAQKFKPGSVVRNQKLGDGAILVFRGGDEEGRMVVLVLSGSAAAGRRGRKPPSPLTLELSYIANGVRPDVFRIRKGQF
jgi:hypothetical protein